MVALTERVQRRLTVEKVEIASDKRQFDAWTGIETALTSNSDSKTVQLTTHSSFAVKKPPSSIPRTRSFASNTWKL